MSAPWYSIRARGASNDTPSAEVYIFGDIGESWWDETVTAKQFVQDFSAIKADQITVRINSYGGSVTDGIAIYNAIKRHPGNITISIEAAAYSIASLIAMAGNHVEMADNALLMIHAPWGMAAGNSADMRNMADTLDKYAQAMAGSYTAKSGKSMDEILSLLTDGQDHWYTAQEAIDAGFVDTITAALPIAASAAILATAAVRHPRSAAARPQFPNPQQAAATTQETPQMAETITPQAAAPQSAETAQRSAQEILAAEKSRRAAVRAEFAPFASRPGMTDLLRDCEDDHACTVEAAAQKILAALAKDVQPIGATHIETVEDETDKQREAIVASILTRAGVADEQTRAKARAGAYRGHRMIDLAKASLDRASIKHGHMDPMQIVAAAFTQGASDFPVLLENAMHKTLQSAYAATPDTWSRFCATGSVSDFRAHPRYRTGSLGNLEQVNELGEFRNKTIPDGEKASVTVGTKGNIINLSRQAIINDDLGAFIGLAANLGRAARRTVETDVYALLALNGGLGPIMADGLPLFDAAHGNIGAAGAGAGTLGVAALDADRVLMASQTDVGGNDYLDLRPSVLLVPLALGGAARAVVGAEYDDESSKNQRRPNVIRNIFDDIVDTPRLTGTRRYMFAAPGDAPVIEVSFLDGNDTPYLEAEQGFSVDGTRWKVRLDYGVGAIDYRGAVTSAGN